jgi:hypothetical protein
MFEMSTGHRNTKSEGQASRVSPFKPGVYLSASEGRQRA